MKKRCLHAMSMEGSIGLESADFVSYVYIRFPTFSCWKKFDASCTVSLTSSHTVIMPQSGRSIWQLGQSVYAKISYKVVSITPATLGLKKLDISI